MEGGRGHHGGGTEERREKGKDGERTRGTKGRSEGEREREGGREGGRSQ